MRCRMGITATMFWLALYGYSPPELHEIISQVDQERLVIL